ncbi:MAG: glycosyltransferase [Barnesiella sp.]|nr:glycosyltransferase [Barnesiella sp.]
MKISVITATYNSGSTIRDTMEAVLRQSYPDIEHIIVDGGSKDNTMDIVQELEPRYNGRLRYISEKDRGIYDAMNKGIAMASGEVVGILNSDDFYTSDTILETVACEFENDDIDAVYGDIHFVNDDNLNKCVRYYSSKSFRPWKMRMGFMPAHPSFYCKREIYNKYGSFDLGFKIGSDFENLLRLIYVNKITAKYIPLDFVTMRTGGASTSGVSSHKQISKDIVAALRKNNVWSNSFIVSLRFPIKLSEMMISRLFKTNYHK